MDNDAAILLVGDAVRAIQKYNSAAEACLSAQKQQMRKTVELLTGSLLRVSDASRESAKNLGTIRDELRAITTVEDLPTLNSRLTDCLRRLCDEVDRQNHAHEQVQSDLGRSAPEIGGLESDSVTGLPGPAPRCLNFRMP
jgi:hypothetical protein